VLRWYCLLKYAEGVSERDGEAWFLETHAPELARADGPYRIFSTRAHKGPMPLPGEWPAGQTPPKSSIIPSWDRLTEYWFETFDEWRAWIKEVVPSLTPPPWAGAVPCLRFAKNPPPLPE
jgi:hypothetical protein